MTVFKQLKYKHPSINTKKITNPHLKDVYNWFSMISNMVYHSRRKRIFTYILCRWQPNLICNCMQQNGNHHRIIKLQLVNLNAYIFSEAWWWDDLAVSLPWRFRFIPSHHMIVVLDVNTSNYICNSNDTSS